MVASIEPQRCWVPIATLEIFNDSASFDALRRHVPPSLRLRQHDAPVADHCWIDLEVWKDDNEIECVRSVWSLIVELERASLAGTFPGFRVITKTARVDRPHRAA